MSIRNIFIALLLGLGLLLPRLSLAQEGPAKVTIQGVIQTEEGQPIVGATLNTTQGQVFAQTDASGAYQMEVPAGALIYIEAKGMEGQSISAEELKAQSTLSMTMAPYHLASSDEVILPFGTLPKRRVVGATTTIKAEEILEYDTRQGILGLIGARAPGVFGNTNVRGLGNALVVVDGIPRGILQSFFNFNVQEIEEITVLRDITARMLYGSQAQNGVILVTTKRGKANKRTTSITAETGFSQPLALPNYLGAADYMELFNEARLNDGLAPSFTPEAIEATRAGNDPLRYPDQDLLSSTFVKPSRPFTSAIMEFGGGSDLAQYYLNVGYRNTGTFLNLGEGAEQRRDQLNIRGNIDYKVNPFITASLDVIAAFDFQQGPVGDFYGDVAGGSNQVTLHPNAYPLLIDTALVNDAELLAAANVLPGGYLPGGTSQLTSNPYADLVQGGYVNANNRLAQLNLGLDFNLDNLTPGLSLSTYLTGNINNQFFNSLVNQYAVYQTSFVDDSLVLSKIGEDAPADGETLSNTSFLRQVGAFATLSYKRNFGEDHAIDAVAVGYLDQTEANGVAQPFKNQHFGFRANYMFRNKFIAELGGAYTGSPVLDPSNQYGFAPAAGLAYVLSEEGFLAESNFIDYLKLKASWGILNTDQGINDYYITQTNFDQTNNFNYGDGTSQNPRMVIQNLANPGLRFAKRQEVSAGFEAALGDLIFLEANYYLSDLYNQIIQPFQTTPAYLGDLVPYQNFGRVREQGVEVGMNIDRRFGDFAVSLGSNFVYSVPKNIELDQGIPAEPYQDRIGQASDAQLALRAIGLFQDSTEILNSPLQSFGTVRPGDIKYEDVNGDGVINNNDQVFIGNGSARFQYGLNLRLSYQGFELFALGTGQTGQEVFLNNSYFWVFGDRRYSDVVLDRWTPATAATATYPRLSSINNPNNFRNSTFWQRSNNGFRLNVVQLSYYLPTHVAGKLGMKRLGVYVQGTNLLDVSANTEWRTLNVGSFPQARNFAAGIRAYFK